MSLDTLCVRKCACLKLHKVSYESVTQKSCIQSTLTANEHNLKRSHGMLLKGKAQSKSVFEEGFTVNDMWSVELIVLFVASTTT